MRRKMYINSIQYNISRDALKSHMPLFVTINEQHIIIELNKSCIELW